MRAMRESSADGAASVTGAYRAGREEIDIISVCHLETRAEALIPKPQFGMPAVNPERCTLRRKVRAFDDHRILPHYPSR
jgi:hypothetical protein